MIAAFSSLLHITFHNGPTAPHTLQLTIPSLCGYFPSEFMGCLFDAAQSVEHMNEGWDGLVATGQPRRQAKRKRAERKASIHQGISIATGPFYSLICDLALKFLT